NKKRTISLPEFPNLGFNTTISKDSSGVLVHGLVRLPVALLVFAAAACTPRYLPRDIAPIPAATPVPGLENARLAPIELSRVTFNSPRGKQIGVSYYDFFSCGGPYSRQLIWSSDRAD